MKRFTIALMLLIAAISYGQVDQVAPIWDLTRPNAKTASEMNNMTRMVQGSEVFRSDTKTIWRYIDGVWVDTGETSTTYTFSTGLTESSGTVTVTNPFDAADENKLDGIATGATVGADWDTNLTNIPANLDLDGTDDALLDGNNVFTGDFILNNELGVTNNNTFIRMKNNGSSLQLGGSAGFSSIYFLEDGSLSISPNTVANGADHYIFDFPVVGSSLKTYAFPDTSGTLALTDQLATAGTDDQTLSLSGTDLSIENGNTVDLSGLGGGTTYTAGDGLSLSVGNEFNVNLSHSVFTGAYRFGINFADDINILDTGSNFTATDVEGALAELAASGGSGTDDQTATEVSFTPNGSIAATNVQAAIQEVRDEAVGTVADGSITNAKLASDAVTSVKVQDGALTWLDFFNNNSSFAGAIATYSNLGVTWIDPATLGSGTDNQQLSISGTTLTLEDGGTPIDLNTTFATDAELASASGTDSGQTKVYELGTSKTLALADFLDGGSLTGRAKVICHTANDTITLPTGLGQTGRMVTAMHQIAGADSIYIKKGTGATVINKQLAYNASGISEDGLWATRDVFIDILPDGKFQVTSDATLVAHTESVADPMAHATLAIRLDDTSIDATATTEGDPVGLWTDIVSGHNATSAGANRPSLHIVGGQRTVSFDGTDDFLEIAAANVDYQNGDEVTFMIELADIVPDNNVGTNYILSKGGFNQSTNHQYTIWASSNATRFNAFGNPATTATDFVANQVLTLKIKATTFDAFMNATKVITDQALTNSATFAVNLILGGNNAGVDNNGTFSMQGMYKYESALSDTEITDRVTYLNAN